MCACARVRARIWMWRRAGTCSRSRRFLRGNRTQSPRVFENKIPSGNSLVGEGRSEIVALFEELSEKAFWESKEGNTISRGSGCQNFGSSTG